MEHDIFISHASEDKEPVVDPLAEALSGRGLDVWYDKYKLRTQQRSSMVECR